MAADLDWKTFVYGSIRGLITKRGLMINWNHIWSLTFKYIWHYQHLASVSFSFSKASWAMTMCWAYTSMQWNIFFKFLNNLCIKICFNLDWSQWSSSQYIIWPKWKIFINVLPRQLNWCSPHITVTTYAAEHMVRFVNSSKDLSSIYKENCTSHAKVNLHPNWLFIQCCISYKANTIYLSLFNTSDIFCEHVIFSTVNIVGCYDHDQHKNPPVYPSSGRTCDHWFFCWNESEKLYKTGWLG